MGLMYAIVPRKNTLDFGEQRTLLEYIKTYGDVMEPVYITRLERVAERLGGSNPSIVATQKETTMTTWFSRVKVYDRFGEVVLQRRIDLEGWKDNITFAATAIGGYFRMSNADVQAITEQEFVCAFSPGEFTPAEDGKSSKLDAEEFFSGVAVTKELALQRYTEAESSTVDDDEWAEEDTDEYSTDDYSCDIRFIK